MSYENIPKNADETRVLTEGDTLTSAFNELIAAELTPVTQLTAPYGFLDKAEAVTVLGGTAIAADSMFQASSGTNPNGTGTVVSRRQVTYKSGQGLLCRIASIFDTPQADSLQGAGLITNSDSLFFGYLGISFGVIRAHGGKSEIQELTITTPAGGSESATITVDGTGYTVPLTSGSAQHNAFEIAVSLNSQVTEYDFSSNNDEVVARSLLFGANLSFAFSSSTAVASWVQISDGLFPTFDFTAQADWNVDTRISGDSDINLDPAKGNIYQIQMQYLGFGGLRFFVEDKKTAKFVLVHVIRYTNTFTIPSFSNPTFRVGWIATNSGNTISLTVKGPSAAGFIEGKAVRTEAPRAAENTNLAVTTANFVNIISIRNRLVFGNKRNRVETFGLSLTAATDSNKDAFIQIFIGADIAGDLDFTYIDKANSTTEVAKDGGVVTGGRLVASFVIPPNSGQPFDLERLSSLILPGTIMTVASILTSGGAAAVNASLIWEEDI